MSTPQLAKADSERPPGPHRPDIQLVAEDATKPSKTAPEKKHDGDIFKGATGPSNKDATRQRFVLTDPIAFRCAPPAVYLYGCLADSPQISRRRRVCDCS